MSRHPPIFPVELKAYMLDTLMLSCEEDGAYWRILRSMWVHMGFLNNDPQQLANIAGVTLERWLEIAPAIMPMFGKRGRTITHARLVATLEKSMKRIAGARVSGAKGGKQKGLNAKAKADSAGYKSVNSAPPKIATGLANGYLLKKDIYSDLSGEVSDPSLSSPLSEAKILSTVSDIDPEDLR